MKEEDRFPCLSVRQPWAWLIISGHKRIENRSWKPYDGFVHQQKGTRIVIHAAKKFEEDSYWQLREDMPELKMPAIPAFRRQSLVGSVTVGSILHKDRRAPWKDQNKRWLDPFSEYHWLLLDPKPFASEISLRGEPYIFWPPLALLRRNGVI